LENQQHGPGKSTAHGGLSGNLMSFYDNKSMKVFNNT